MRAERKLIGKWQHNTTCEITSKISPWALNLQVVKPPGLSVFFPASERRQVAKGNNKNPEAKVEKIPPAVDWEVVLKTFLNRFTPKTEEWRYYAKQKVLIYFSKSPRESSFPGLSFLKSRNSSGFFSLILFQRVSPLIRTTYSFLITSITYFSAYELK